MLICVDYRYSDKQQTLVYKLTVSQVHCFQTIFLLHNKLSRLSGSHININNYSVPTCLYLLSTMCCSKSLKVSFRAQKHLNQQQLSTIYLHNIILQVPTLFSEMAAREADLISARIPPAYRDYCSHKLLEYHECRYKHIPLVYKCAHEKHDYLNCEHEE